MISPLGFIVRLFSYYGCKPVINCDKVNHVVSPKNDQNQPMLTSSGEGCFSQQLFQLSRRLAYIMYTMQIRVVYDWYLFWMYRIIKVVWFCLLGLILWVLVSQLKQCFFNSIEPWCSCSQGSPFILNFIFFLFRPNIFYL